MTLTDIQSALLDGASLFFPTFVDYCGILTDLGNPDSGYRFMIAALDPLKTVEVLELLYSCKIDMAVSLNQSDCATIIDNVITVRKFSCGKAAHDFRANLLIGNTKNIDVYKIMRMI